MTRVPDVGPSPTPDEQCYRCITSPVDTVTPGPGLCRECLDHTAYEIEHARRHAADTYADTMPFHHNRWAAL